MNILLSGPPFSGKTTIGTELANELGWELINTDTILENKYQMSCPEQFKTFGEVQFRKNEWTMLKELQVRTLPSVISLGGGSLTYEPSAHLAKKLGLIVCLEGAFDVLYDRLRKSGRTPAYLDPNDLEGSYKKLIEMRNQHYRQYGDFFVDVTNKTPQELAKVIINEFKRRYG